MKKEELEVYRLAAIIEAERITRHYQDRNFLDSLVSAISEKRLANIRQAKTKTDIDEALKLSTPRFDGVKFYPKYKYHIEEEELILWSETSLKGPLINEGFKRYQYLFQKYVADLESLEILR